MPSTKKRQVNNACRRDASTGAADPEGDTQPRAACAVAAKFQLTLWF
jgi:hypothetical protein